jgi:hypothetical protein
MPHVVLRIARRKKHALIPRLEELFRELKLGEPEDFWRVAIWGVGLVKFDESIELFYVLSGAPQMPSPPWT